MSMRLCADCLVFLLEMYLNAVAFALCLYMIKYDADMHKTLQWKGNGK